MPVIQVDPDSQLPARDQEIGRVPVVYIGGMGRGGSTVVSAVLGGFSSFLPVGELRGIWSALRTNERCGCGQPCSGCPYWVKVGHAAFGGWSGVDFDRMLHADAQFCRHRDLPRLLMLRRFGSAKSLFEEYTSAMSKVYSAIHLVSEVKGVIVDSTKDAPYAFLLRELPNLDLQVLHLIRDSRAVAFSWRRRVARPEYAHIPSLRATAMDQMSPSKTSIHWLMRNGLFHVLTGRGVSTLRVTYEEFVADPSSTVTRIARWCGCEISTSELAALDGCAFESLPHHTLGGNRMRFERGRTAIRLDDEWIERMPSGDRRLVTAMTMPLLRKYGYERHVRV